MYCETIDQLQPLLNLLRRSHEKIVLAPGCFDLLHIGHVRLLQEAKRRGSFLIVATNTDASIARAKGPDRPIVALADRVAILQALACVDAVISYEDDTPTELARLIRPDVMVKGSQYAETIPPGSEFCRAVYFARMVPDRSTTSMAAAIHAP